MRRFALLVVVIAACKGKHRGSVEQPKQVKDAMQKLASLEPAMVTDAPACTAARPDGTIVASYLTVAGYAQRQVPGESDPNVLCNIDPVQSPELADLTNGDKPEAARIATAQKILGAPAFVVVKIDAYVAPQPDAGPGLIPGSMNVRASRFDATGKLSCVDHFTVTNTPGFDVRSGDVLAQARDEMCGRVKTSLPH